MDQVAAIKLIFIFLLYMFPWVVSNWRERSNRGAIFIWCALVNWTVIGWFVMLTIAMTGEGGKARMENEKLRDREVDALEKIAAKKN